MAKLKGQLFARLALDYFDHPKIMQLSADAIVAHLEMIVYSRRYDTDGAIPMRFAMRFATEVLDELASNDPDSPSIIRNDDGTVRIHGYADMQETSEQIAARRQARADAGKRGAAARWQANGKPDGKSHGKPDGKHDGKKMAETETETETDTSSLSEKRTRTRAHQLPDDWTPSTEHQAQAAERGLDVGLEADKMRDWAKGKGESRKDWEAVFRNWLRNARPPQQLRPAYGQKPAVGIASQMDALKFYEGK